MIKKIGPRVTDDGCEKQWFGALSRDPDLISDQRDGLHTKSRIPNYATARLENSESSGPSRNIGAPYDSWKNSEEEEFMWDMHSRLSETDVATINPKNELQAADESERLVSYDSNIHYLLLCCISFNSFNFNLFPSCRNLKITS